MLSRIWESLQSSPIDYSGLGALNLTAMTASALTIELLSQQEQTAFNLRRWEELVADPELTKIEGRIETDRHGHILMSPPAFANHGRRQFLIAKSKKPGPHF